MGRPVVAVKGRRSTCRHGFYNYLAICFSEFASLASHSLIARCEVQSRADPPPGHLRSPHQHVRQRLCLIVIVLRSNDDAVGRAGRRDRLVVQRSSVTRHQLDRRLSDFPVPTIRVERAGQGQLRSLPQCDPLARSSVRTTRRRRERSDGVCVRVSSDGMPAATRKVSPADVFADEGPCPA